LILTFSYERRALAISRIYFPNIQAFLFEINI